MAKRTTKLEQLIANPDDARHGKASSYQAGCRCKKCSTEGHEQIKQYARDRRARIKDAKNAKKEAEEIRNIELLKQKQKEEDAILKARYVNPVRHQLSEKARESREKRLHDKRTTMNQDLIPMMYGPTIKSRFCVVCGSPNMLEQHHPVKRSEGELFIDGRKKEKPTLTLCKQCHKRVHDKGELWFRFEKANAYKELKDSHEYLMVYSGGHWEFLEIDREKVLKEHPEFNGRVGYSNALTLDGWKRIRT